MLICNKVKKRWTYENKPISKILYIMSYVEVEITKYFNTYLLNKQKQTLSWENLMLFHLTDFFRYVFREH